jgi:hypothetical protein
MGRWVCSVLVSLTFSLSVVVVAVVILAVVEAALEAICISLRLISRQEQQLSPSALVALELQPLTMLEGSVTTDNLPQ